MSRHRTTVTIRLREAVDLPFGTGWSAQIAAPKWMADYAEPQLGLTKGDARYRAELEARQYAEQRWPRALHHVDITFNYTED